MAPVLISLAGTNVMLVIVTALASRGDGWPAWLNYAFRLVHLPIGLVGVAVGTVLLAAGSRSVAAGDPAALDGIVGRGLRLTWLLALPAAVGLFVLAEPLIRLIYERGRFHASDTLAVSRALKAYALGVVFYAGVKASAPRFLARGDTRTPMQCSVAGILVTIAAAFLFVGPWGYVGLALSVAMGSATNYAGLWVAGRRRYGRRGVVGAAFLARIGGAALLMAGAGILASRLWLVGDGAVASRPLRVGLTLGLTVALAALYLLAASVLGVEEVAALARRLGWRRGRSGGEGPVS
jgi:putative peptidoglycan lipid II flippase